MNKQQALDKVNEYRQFARSLSENKLRDYVMIIALLKGVPFDPTMMYRLNRKQLLQVLENGILEPMEEKAEEEFQS